MSGHPCLCQQRANGKTQAGDKKFKEELRKKLFHCEYRIVTMKIEKNGRKAGKYEEYTGM